MEPNGEDGGFQRVCTQYDDSKESESMSREDLLWNPQTLYHYTTREGLLGILCSGTVWTTNIRFLNDASEYTYAQSKFNRGAS
jgi:hypothetical protein